jgi:hypothetical protein
MERFTYNPEKFDAMRETGVLDPDDFDLYMQDNWEFEYDDDGFAADLLFQAALAAGVITEPKGVAGYFHFIPGRIEGDSPAYQYNLYIAIPEAGSLKVSTYEYEYPDFCTGDAKGRAAVEGMLQDAVVAMNSVLEQVDALIARRRD